MPTRYPPEGSEGTLRAEADRFRGPEQMTTVPDPTNPFSVAHGGGTPSAGSYGTVMLTALVRLHHALQGVRLPLEMPGIEEQRTGLREMVDQLEDYVIPRVTTLEAPLLAVVGGSTGAGKSTLVNSLVGHKVTQPGLLRPTTRSPVLVHHPDDASWFGADRLLPDLERVDHPTTDPAALQLVAAEEVPPGLAILDAPDVDSVVEENRELAAQLLAAADLWLFVTSAARYADQVPWEFLRQAAERSTSVAIVLDRTPEDAVQTVATHLARMLASRGLKDSPLFVVHEGPVSEEELLPADHVAEIRGWLESLAGDAGARQQVVIQTLDGAVRTLTRRTYPVADAAAEQVAVADRLRQDATAAYDEGIRKVLAGMEDGTLLRGEVLARWQEFVGTGELLKGLESRVGRIRDRLVNTVKGKPHQAERVTVAVESGLEMLILEHAEAAAERAEASWRQLDVRAGAAQGRWCRARPGLARPAPQRRAVGAGVAGGRAEHGPHPGPGQAHHRPLPRLRGQRAVGGADDRRLLLLLRPHRRRGRHRRRLGGARPEAARGRLRRPGRAQPRRAGPAVARGPGAGAVRRRAGSLHRPPRQPGPRPRDAGAAAARVTSGGGRAVRRAAPGLSFD